MAINYQHCNVHSSELFMLRKYHWYFIECWQTFQAEVAVLRSVIVSFYYRCLSPVRDDVES